MNLEDPRANDIASSSASSPSLTHWPRRPSAVPLAKPRHFILPARESAGT